MKGSTSILFLAVLTLAMAAICSSARTLTSTPPPTDFILTSCNATRYPDLCVRTLSPYASTVHGSRRQLAYAALTISSTRARSTSSLVIRIASGFKPARSTQTRPVLDCTETIKDSNDRLTRAMRQMNRMGRSGSRRFKAHLSNVQAWVSGALTDASTCLEFLDQDAHPTVQAAIRNKVVELTHITSNALALINRIELRN